MQEENDETDEIFHGNGERWLLNRFLEDMANIQMLTREEEAEVAARAAAGDVVSRNSLVTANMRFVLKVAFKYWSPGRPLMNMIAEGCMGLIKASKTYTPDKGFRFLTCAGKGVVQCVIRAIEDHDEYKHESIDEIIPYDSEDEVATTQRDILVSNAPQSEEIAFYNQLPGLLNRLNARERKVVTLRFWHYLSLDETGRRIGLKKERTRQIELKALRKLRWAIERTTIGHGSHADTAR